MERYTERDEYGNADIIGVDSQDWQLSLEFDEFNQVTAALNRLASLEDQLDSGELVRVVHGEWNGWTKSAFMGTDEYSEPIYSDRKFYRCTKCRYGTVIKSKFCPNCGAKMDGKPKE